MNRVFYNVIENTIQHSEGERVRIRGKNTGKEVILIIEDDGRGIPDEEMDKIFNKGYTTDDERGTGLGMFLAKTLLDIYGGTIEVKKSEWNGARFDIHLKKV